MQPSDEFPSTPSTPGPALDSVNAEIKPITISDTIETYGTLNQRPSEDTSYQIGISDGQGMRPSMEDSYGFVIDYDSIRGQGFFGVFDGHGNKLAAEWCGAEFHKHLLRAIHENPDMPTIDILAVAFKSADDRLSLMSQESANMAASGCTAAVAFLRLEDTDEKQPFLNRSSFECPGNVPAVTPPSSAKRVLYCANAGDTRVVLSRGGKAERLTYDHKASVKTEIERVRKANGIIFRGRVLGYLNVTRSLGNHEAHEGYSIKKFVVGTPYTTQTELTNQDDFFIIACDGLWDVVSDQEAVDLVKGTRDAQIASKMLMDLAFENGTRDNVTVMVVRFTGSY